jgi:uncharacterized protein
MQLNAHLFKLFSEKAHTIPVDIISIGLGYTAVTTADGGIGIAYTYYESKKACSVFQNYKDFEGSVAPGLLEGINSTDPLYRSLALAFINALNHQDAALLPEDPANKVLFDTFGLSAGARVAMAGFFGPLVKKFKERKVLLEIIDESRGLGQKDMFFERLQDWADVLFLTSTSILNNTTEEILSHVGRDVKTVLLGPSTPMVAKAFDHLPVHMLAGSVPLQKESVLKAVRHGLGTPALQKFSHKCYLTLD